MDPIKIIFQFKNSKRKIQHHQYIFIGKVNDDILDILNLIKNKTLTQTFRTLTKKQYSLLENGYGLKWYFYFFNKYHMIKSFANIKSVSKLKAEILKIMGDKWYSEHVVNFEQQNKKLFYNYEIDNIKKSKIQKYNLDIYENESELSDEDLNDEVIEINDIKNMDGTEFKNQLLSKISKKEYLSKENLKHFFSKVKREINEDEISGGSNEVEEEINLEELENIYRSDDVKKDDNIEKTKSEIMKVVKVTRKRNTLMQFDDSKDNIYSDEDLSSVYVKNYITSQYINKDDTVKIIKDKICCSIMNNEKFGKRRYIIPSRQYLWTEYYFENKINYVSLCHQWIKKNSLVNISIKPEQISNYEKLKKENLINLKFDLTSNISKLKREDNEDKILGDFDKYYDAHTLFMIDIYNELGKNYKKTSQTEYMNLVDVYIKLYFPQIAPDEIDNILSYLESSAIQTTEEGTKMKQIYETLYNDLLLVNEVIDEVNNIKINNKEYTKIFGNKYITNSTVNVNLNNFKEKCPLKFDFFRMFNNFETNNIYPFVQYQSSNGSMVFKFNTKYINLYIEKKENISVLMKWFESSPYGFNIKMKIDIKDNAVGDEKFIGVTIGDNGNLEYRIQWKEDNNASLDDIQKTYSNIKELISKLNSESTSGTLFKIPLDQEFRYAFINCIQHFSFNDEFAINHNDLSEFSRYFYPFVAVVLQPVKRLSKQFLPSTEYGKYGTYLRYKRISNYYNRQKVEQQIIYFLRYYEDNLSVLVDEISKQFNITKEKAMNEITTVSSKYSNIKKGRKILKEFKNIPRKKPLGIGIEIQGKSKKKYKIRISGCRNEKQLMDIISFLNVMIYLYSETFLYKKPERQKMLDKLKTLTSIAKRRDKVEYITDYSEKNMSVLKKKTRLDSDRIGFEATKGQNQWTRMCQNSGDSNRQPIQNNEVEEIIKQGYTLNSVNGMYEKRVTIGNKTHILRAVQFDRNVSNEISEEMNDGKKLFYSCDPTTNGEFVNIGFLTKGRNPSGKCMPCCYKKDQMNSKNKIKARKFLSCTRNKNADSKSDDEKIEDDDDENNNDVDGKNKNLDGKNRDPTTVGDVLYILHNTNKIQENRLSLLPPNLNILFNVVSKLSLKVDGNYITSTEGFFVKYGVNQISNAFINSISNLFNITSKQLIDKIISVLNNDKKDIIFNSISNGSIRQKFDTREKYIEYLLKENIQINFVIHFLSIPSVLTEYGVNIIVFTEIEETKDFNLLCYNSEEEDSLSNSKRQNIIIINEADNYYPIVKIFKELKSKTIKITKHFHGISEVKNIEEFYRSNCKINFFLNNKELISAKSMCKILESMNSKYHPHSQIIDSRFKVNYIITKNKTIIPVTPSGSIYNLNIELSVSKYLSEFRYAYDNCINISATKKINLLPLSLFYLNMTKTSYTIIGIKTQYGNIQTKPSNIQKKWIDDNKLKVEKQHLTDMIDAKLKAKEHYIDDRVKSINNKNYDYESYNLFRMELSEYIFQNEKLRQKIVDILKLENKNTKKNKLLLLLSEITNQTNTNKLLITIKEAPNTDDYIIENFRNTCSSKSAKYCPSKHCMLYGKKCMFTLTNEMKIVFLHRVINEFISDKIKMMELLKQDEYFVSDIGDYDKYRIKLNQKIIKSTNIAIKTELQNIFKNTNIPVIRKRRREILEDEQLLNSNHPVKNLGTYSTQQIISTDSPIYRAFTNSYIWFKQQIYYSYQVNLGYYSERQTSYSNYFKSLVIDWLSDAENSKYFKEIKTFFGIKKSNSEIITSINNNEILKKSLNVFELFALHNIYKIPIIIYNGLFDSVACLINNKIENNSEKYNLLNNSEIMRKSLHISIEYNNDNYIETIYSIYLN